MNASHTEEKRSIAERLKQWGVFLAVALGVLALMVLPYVIRGKYLVWGHEGADGVTQHATFLEYIFRHGIFGGLGGYDYNVGLGSDYAVSFAYYMLFDPLNFLLYLLPRGNFLLSYSILGVVRLLLAAVCAYIYLLAHKVRQPFRVLFSLAYMLCGYMVFTFWRHPDLTSGAIYLPLLALGVELCVRRSRPWLMIGTVFVITLASFYMAYMVTLYAIAYAVVLYIGDLRASGEKGTARRFFAVFFRTAGCYLIGLLLASFVLFPVAHGYLTASRSAGKGMHVYSVRDLFFFAGSFFVPTPGGKYTFIMLNACALMLVFAAFAARVRTPHKAMTAIFTAGIFIPLFGYLMNLCNYVSNRFSYMLGWSVCALLAEYCNSRTQDLPSPRESNAMVKGIFTALLLTLDLAAWTAALFSLDFVPHFVGALFVTLAVAASVGSFVGLRKFYRKDFGSEKARRRVSLRRVCAGFAALTLGGALIFGGIYSGQYDDGSVYAALRSEAEAYVAALDKDEFVRLDQSGKGWENRPVNSGYRGTIVYNTLTSGATADFAREHALYTFSPSLGLSGLGNRTALQVLLGAKYFRAPEGGYVPMQYLPAASGTKELYETDMYMRFGTVYGENETVSPAAWAAFPDYERQYVALDAVLIDGGRDWSEEEREAAKIGMRWEDPSAEDFTLYRDAHGVSLSNFRLPSESVELYLRFSIDIPEEFGVKFEVRSGGISYPMRTEPRGEQMYTGETDFLLKLDEKSETVDFVHTFGGSLRVHDLQFFAVSARDAAEKIARAVRRDHLENTKFTDTRIEGTVTSDGGYMRIPLAYSSGWTAKVDGASTPVLAADGGLMAIRIESGTHTVVLSYDTPWRTLGLLGTVAAAVALSGTIAAYVVLALVRKHKNKSADGV